MIHQINKKILYASLFVIVILIIVMTICSCGIKAKVS